MNRKIVLILSLAILSAGIAKAQDEDKGRGFDKTNLFTGGSLSLSFFNNSFLIGVNPVFGYSLTRWADLGLVINYNYSSYRDYNQPNDKLRQTIYGGGLFTRIFPVRFLFGQAQIEHNWIQLKYIPPNNGSTSSNSVSSNSILVGAGYTTGRDPDSKSLYGDLSVLFDVSKNTYSPYVDNLGRAIPIIRAGIHIPLFQGK